MFIFCNSNDLPKIKTLLAALGERPKGIIVYPATDIRVGSWIEPSGDHKEAGRFLTDMLAQANLRPSLNWEKDFFPKKPDIHDDTFVQHEDVYRAKAVVNSPTGLKVINPNGSSDSSGFRNPFRSREDYY
jgi:hypothetical protein